jgi:hypothetical protein
LEEDARIALEDCLRVEPDWVGRLRVETIELDEGELSTNFSSLADG